MRKNSTDASALSDALVMCWNWYSKQGVYYCSWVSSNKGSNSNIELFLRPVSGCIICVTFPYRKGESALVEADVNFLQYWIVCSLTKGELCDLCSC